MFRIAAIIVTIFTCNTALLYAEGEFARVPTGSFSRGADDGKADERPVRAVEMSGFGIMSKEVTEAQYQKCVDAGRCAPAHYDDGKCLMWRGRQFQRVTVPQNLRGENLPVVCVTWQEARAYCASVGAKLPTEAQWEYAALGGAQSAKYSWGNGAPDRSRCGLSAPQPAGSFAPNGYGLHDMTGNVWEWTADFYAADYYENSEAMNPKGPDAGYYRVIRGGGWYSGASELRVKNRHWFSAASAEVSVGFRCVK
jgi:formylglycine-generating enzyme required for sulfatase activity